MLLQGTLQQQQLQQHTRCSPQLQLPRRTRTSRQRTLAATSNSMQKDTPTPPPSSSSPASSHTTHFLELGPQHTPRLGLGLAALGRPGYINLGHGSDLVSSSGREVDTMRQHCWDVLDAAWSLGIRYFDAARSYGRAEEFLAGWLQARNIPPEAVVVGSKWGYTYTAGWQVDTGGQPHEVKEHTADNLTKQAAETQQHLGKYLGLYQIHSATLESGVLQCQPVLKQLAELKTTHGWRMGLSVSGVQQADVITQAMSVIDSSGQPLFECVQVTWNLLEQSAGPALLAARESGRSVIVKEAMANGRLTPRNADPAFAHKLRLLCDTAQQFNTTPDALALACVLQQPFQPMVLSGAATVQQLQQNYAALELAEQRPGSVEQQLQEALRQPPQQYWEERSGLAWN